MLKSAIALFLALAALSSCTKPAPTVTVLGTVVSSNGEQALTFFAVVPGSIIDDYLAVNLSKPGAPYSERQTVASFSRANEMRAFWTATGRPAVMAQDLEGTIFSYGKASRLVVCHRIGRCPSLPANARQITLAKFPLG